MEEIPFKCVICQYEFEVEKYAGGQCPRCKQDYQYDNDVYRPDLTPKQIKLLQEAATICFDLFPKAFKEATGKEERL